MTTELAILLDGRLAAWARRNQNGRIALTYEKAWLHAPDSFPLSLSMPLVDAPHGHKKLDPYLWGLLPDNDAVLRVWGRRFDVSAANSFSLLAHVGEDCAGAVQVVRPERLDACLSAQPEPLQKMDHDEIAERLRLLHVDPSAGRTPKDIGPFSLAGAQPKTALLYRNGQWYVPSGRTPTTHILKPSLIAYPGHAENEHFCTVLARKLGLLTTDSEVLKFGEEVAIVVKRYDRRHTKHGIQRLHQEDMCQALRIYPTRKYQDDGGPGVHDIVELLRTRSTKRKKDETSFLDAVAFNWLIGGTDAHAKNYSLLIGAGTVRFAPLYDLASALPYENLDVWKLRFAMKIGRHYRMRDVNGRQWEKLAARIHIKSGILLGRIAEMAAKIPSAAETAKQQLTEEGLSHPIIGRLHDHIVARAANCARLVEATLGRT